MIKVGNETFSNMLEDFYSLRLDAMKERFIIKF